MMKRENRDLIRVHLYASAAAASHTRFPSGLVLAPPDCKGAEGADAHSIPHTDQRSIGRYLFDNAHAVADGVISWPEYDSSRSQR